MTGVGGTGTTGTGAGGAGGCMSAADCDDSLPCTVDSCNVGACQHTPTVCPQAQLCDAVKGCVPAMACSSTAQCVTALGADACKANILCDPAQSICTYEVLDKDGDGYPPVVCGGTDCDDSDPNVHPGAAETCDGKDDDCNGKIDDGATCPGGMESCQAGVCVCPPGNLCGGVCSNLTNDHDHCGSCNNACPAAASCIASNCVRPANAADCNGVCVDLKNDPQNCNACGSPCGPGYSCSNGSCTCSKSICNGACIDTSSDPNNCGACNKFCPPGATCQQSSCVCGQGLELCAGQCTDPSSDPNNCGFCGKVCGVGQPCVNNVCQAQQLYFPSGPQTNVPVGMLTGWKVCYQDTYNVVMGSVISTIQANCSLPHILMACGPNGAASYQLWPPASASTCSPRRARPTTTRRTSPMVSGGISIPAYSWGFVPAADIPTKNSCDTGASPDNPLRLCWHTIPANGGYRCGANIALNSSATMSRYVFEAP